MSAKHAPGTWWLTSHGDVRDEGGLICSMRRPSHYPEQDERYEREVQECKAKACLIAAGPDLYAALRDCVLVMQNDLKGLAVIQPELRGALAAIFKATGETP